MKASVGASPLFNTQCPSFAPFQCSLVSPLFRFAYSGSGVALFTPVFTPVPVFRIGANSTARGSPKAITC